MYTDIRLKNINFLPPKLNVSIKNKNNCTILLNRRKKLWLESFKKKKIMQNLKFCLDFNKFSKKKKKIKSEPIPNLKEKKLKFSKNFNTFLYKNPFILNRLYLYFYGYLHAVQLLKKKKMVKFSKKKKFLKKKKNIIFKFPSKKFRLKKIENPFFNKKYHFTLKKTFSVNLKKCQAYIYVSFTTNNIIVNLTTPKKKTLYCISSGMLKSITKKSARKSSFAAFGLGKCIKKLIFLLKIRSFGIFVRGINKARISFLKGLTFFQKKTRLNFIQDVTKIPFNGCRKKKRQRK